MLSAGIFTSIYVFNMALTFDIVLPFFHTLLFVVFVLSVFILLVWCWEQHPACNVRKSHSSANAVCKFIVEISGDPE